MPKRFYLSCLWPGLPELWFRGQLASLPIAIAFAVALNAVLIARYIFPGLLPTALVSMAFWIGLALWGVCSLHSMRELPALVCPRIVADTPDRFVEAQTAYLAGDYAAAEEAINEVLAIEARDPPALLMLCQIYRHTERLESAEILLAEIRRTEAADGWFLEIAAEEKRLFRDDSDDDEIGETGGDDDSDHDSD